MEEYSHQMKSIRGQLSVDEELVHAPELSYPIVLLKRGLCSIITPYIYFLQLFKYIISFKKTTIVNKAIFQLFPLPINKGNNCVE